MELTWWRGGCHLSRWAGPYWHCRCDCVKLGWGSPAGDPPRNGVGATGGRTQAGMANHVAGGQRQIWRRLCEELQRVSPTGRCRGSRKVMWCSQDRRQRRSYAGPLNPVTHGGRGGKRHTRLKTSDDLLHSTWLLHCVWEWDNDTGHCCALSCQSSTDTDNRQLACPFKLLSTGTRQWIYWDISLLTQLQITSWWLTISFLMVILFT